MESMESGSAIIDNECMDMMRDWMERNPPIACKDYVDRWRERMFAQWDQEENGPTV